MAGRFELRKNTNGLFHFVLKAGNGEIIAVSEMYMTKAAALNGIESIKRNASIADVADLSEGAWDAPWADRR